MKDRGQIEKEIMQILTTEPITQRQLADTIGCTTAQIRIAIHNLRMDGEKICSGGDGVWLWNGEDDSWAYTRKQLRSRAKSLLKLCRAMDMTHEGQGKQERLDLRR